MTSLAVSGILVGLIVAILVWRATVIIRAEKHQGRGSLPGKGVQTLISDYSSGMGGGSYREYDVPRDPQDYAKLFVPKKKDTDT